MLRTPVLVVLLAILVSLVVALNNDERAALKAIWNDHYSVLSGLQPPWSDDVSHACGSHPSPAFYGISCTATGTISSINLQLPSSSSRLVGTIPPEIGFLKDLTYLNLRGNDFYGQIPSSFTSLANLQFLDVSSNSLNGSFSSIWTSMPNLQILQLSWNQLSGTIPNSIGNLTQLYFLALSGNDMNGTIPASLTQIPSLRYLSLSNNHFEICPVPPFSNAISADITGQTLVAHGDCNCADDYPQGSRATCIAPWTDFPDNSGDSCPLPSPGDGFNCSDGAWIYNGHVNAENMQITGVVQVGSINVTNSLIIEGLTSFLTAPRGCVSISGSVVLSLSFSDIQKVRSVGSEWRMLLASQDLACENPLSALSVTVSTPTAQSSCSKISVTSENTSSDNMLVVSFVVTTKSWKCGKIWIPITAASVGVVLLVVAFIAWRRWKSITAKRPATPRVNAEA